MNYTAVIDISTFIWSKSDYENNKHEYHKLLSVLPTVYEQISLYKVPTLLRKELYELILSEFPYNMIREISYEFEYITLSFLTNTPWLPYLDNDDESIQAVPPLIKPHFNQGLQRETQSQVCHLYHNVDNPPHKLVAYSYFFTEDNLLINKHEEKIVIGTLRYNSEHDVTEFFEGFQIKFEHNPKHTKEVKIEGGEKISPFTCYHQPDGEEKASKLLKDAFFYKGFYYNFDLENDVYVRFIKTNGRVFHGHDLSDEKNNIPDTVRKNFNKYGKVF